MRNWQIRANGPCVDCGCSEPYTAGEDVRRYLETHPEATEADVERIARIYHCSVIWTLQPHSVTQQLDDMGIAQIQLPSPHEKGPHPRLLVADECIHTGQPLDALFPDGWHTVTLDVHHDIIGPDCWYISTPGYEDICPVGLFVKW